VASRHSFFVTHDLPEAVYVAQRAIVMSARSGRVKADIDIVTTRTGVTRQKDFYEMGD
jgi:ABC-type nitrate/sulfonate/bicarbonate transport system ATPase subunit